jgi:hypothetical protein
MNIGTTYPAGAAGASPPSQSTETTRGSMAAATFMSEFESTKDGTLTDQVLQWFQLHWIDWWANSTRQPTP